MRRTILACLATAAVTHAQAFADVLVPATSDFVVAAGKEIDCPSIVAGEGGAVVVFTDADNDWQRPKPPRVHSRYLSRGGVPSALRALSEADHLITSPGAVRLSGGDILVYWLNARSFYGERNRLRYRLLDSHGRPIGPTRTAEGIADLTRSLPFEIPALRAVAVGEAAVMVWKSSGRPPMAMRVDPRAAANGRPQPLEGLSRESVLVAVGTLGGRGLLVASEEIDGDEKVLEVRAFGEELEALAAATRITSRPRRSSGPGPEVRLEGSSDRFVVVWNDATSFDEFLRLRGNAVQRVIGVDGEPLSPGRVIGDFLVGALDVDEEGSFVVAGTRIRKLEPRGIFALLHSPDGAALGDPVRLDHPDRLRSEACPVVASGAEGEWWAAWLDFRSPAAGDPQPVRQVRMRRLTRQD